MPKFISKLAPPGYIAIRKKDRDCDESTRNKNICTFCDWRKDCCDWQPEYTHDARYHCMSDNRSDGESVIFLVDPNEAVQA